MGLRPAQAEVVAQIVWRKFLQHGPAFSGGNAAECHAWLVRVTHNEVVTFLRELARRPKQWPENVELPDLGEEERAAHKVLFRESALFRRWLEELGQKDPLRRDLVWARHIEGVKPMELAKKYGNTAHWVSVEINRALTDFRAWVLQHEHDGEEEA
jgi:DNA-directed RNA polymerase specialized sigma24 family protein